MADAESRQGSSYQEPEIRAFVDRVHHRETEAMADSVRALDAASMPAIQVGRGDGAILELLVAAVGARKVVEIGTLSGYSALWILRGLAPGGRLWTLEADPAHAEVAGGVFRRAGVADRVELLVGPAVETLPVVAAHGPFDAVFIDADKASYGTYGRWARDNLRSGGLVLADNAFLFGRLAGAAPDERVSAQEIEAMQDFHRFVAERFESSCCLPTPDGLLVARAP